MNAVSDYRSNLGKHLRSDGSWNVSSRIDGDDFPDSSCLDLSFCSGIAGIEATNMSNHEILVACLRSFHDCTTILYRGGHRLFEKHMLAGLQRGQCRCCMLIPHGCDVYDLNFGISQQIIVVGVGLLYIEAFGNFFQAVWGSCAEGMEIDVWNAG